MIPIILLWLSALHPGHCHDCPPPPPPPPPRIDSCWETAGLNKKEIQKCKSAAKLEAGAKGEENPLEAKVQRRRFRP